MDQKVALTDEASGPRPGSWVDSSAIDGARWVDPSDAFALDAWGSAAPAAEQPVFDPQKAAQEKPVPQRRTSLTVSDVALGREDRIGGSLREEINKQGTHQQTHPRQQQRWTPSPAMSPALMTPADDSAATTSDENLDEDPAAAAEHTNFPAVLVTQTSSAASKPQPDVRDILPHSLLTSKSETGIAGLGRPLHAQNGTVMEHPLADSSSDAQSSDGSEVDDDEEAESEDGDIPMDVAKALGPDNLRALKQMGQGTGGLDAEFRLPSGFAQDAHMNGGHRSDAYDDEEGSSGTENMGGSSDDDLDADYDPSFAFAPKCINCTAPLLMDAPCTECGHDPADNDALFSTMQHLGAGVVGREGTLAAGTTVLAYDERMTLHEEDSTSPHPERPDRIRVVIARLMSSGLADRCKQTACREATVDEIEACHKPELVRAVAALSAAAAGSEGEPSSPAYFTQDTYVNASTFLCARLAAGGCIDVAAAVAGGAAQNGAAIVRPPGHHAEGGMAMGFCYFNNAGLAARAAQAAGARRVLVLDWDVHHGNGTQHIFEDDPSVMYLSIHRYDGGHFYPGTGAVQEVGEGAGEGYTVNVPWPMGGMGNGDYMAAFNHVIIPIAHEYSPDLIVVSAGFDASAGDPIGGCRVTPECYAHMTAMLGAVAPLAVLLEGGYNLAATAAGCEAVLRVLLGAKPPRFAKPAVPCTAALMALQQVVTVQGKYWRCLRGLSEQSAFNPFQTPYARLAAGHARRASLDADLSPRQPAKKLRPAPPGDAPHHRPGASPPQHAACSDAPVRARGGETNGAKWGPSNGPTSPRGVIRVGGDFGQGSPGSVSRALHRTKFIAKRHRGKSQRRWQMLHALHLVALRDMIKRHYRGRGRRAGLAHSQGSGQMGTPLNSVEGSP